MKGFGSLQFTVQLSVDQQVWDISKSQIILAPQWNVVLQELNTTLKAFKWLISEFPIGFGQECSESPRWGRATSSARRMPSPKLMNLSRWTIFVVGSFTKCGIGKEIWQLSKMSIKLPKCQGWQAKPSLGHPLRCHQEQEKEPHLQVTKIWAVIIMEKTSFYSCSTLQREADWGNNVPLPRTLRRPQEVARCQGGVIPVQEYVPGRLSPVNLIADFLFRLCLFMTNCNAFNRARTLRA